ncbi:MAG: molybdopterin guanine dinucleotide synthesis [Gemmobacter sp.]
MRPDAVLIVDWSAAARPTPPRPSADAIWIGRADARGVTARYHRTRADAMAALSSSIDAAVAAGQRLLIGADFPFGYPAGFARALTGRDGALAVWDWLAAQVEDGPDNASNRFALAAAINARLPGIGPFWGRPAGLALPDLPDRGTLRHGHGMTERRMVERRLPRAQPVWKLYTTGSVGSQAILGIAALARLRAAYPGRIAVWPFEDWRAAPVVLAEVWPSLLDGAVRAAIAGGAGPVKDAVQVTVLASHLYGRDLGPILAPDAPAETLVEEGWILGAP